MNYYLWVEVKTLVGSIFIWDSLTTMQLRFGWADIAGAYLTTDLGNTARAFLVLGMIFLLSALIGGLGSITQDYKMKASVQ